MMTRRLERRTVLAFVAALAAVVHWWTVPSALQASEKIGPDDLPDTPAAVFSVTNNLNSGAGSLRQAILDANASPGADTISFNIPGGGFQTIATLTRMVAAANEPVTIDGTTQPGYAGTPLVIIDGVGASSGHECLTLSGNSTVKGLAFVRCRSQAIQLNSGGNNVVAANFLGVNPSNEADTASGNSQNGVLINGTANNRIGGTTAAERNIIARNSNGITVLGSTATDNVITGNYIGLLSNGTTAARNLITGVTINNAPQNRIGGPAAGERNVISGHTGGSGAGVLIDGSQSAGNQVLGNYIGTDLTGMLARGNQFGVRITEGINSVIGGSVGTTPGGPCTGACNLIAASGGTGISVTSISGGATGTVIEGNYVNTDVTGSNLLGAAAFLVTSVNIGASNTRLGGSSPAARNVIVNAGTSANNNVSIGTSNLSNIVVTGNFIGTNAAGTAALGLAQAGVSIGSNASIVNTRIGGSTPGEGNLISGGNQVGVLIGVSSGTQVSGNRIGTDVTGTLDLGNTLDGVLIQGGTSSLIGASAGTTFAGPCTGGCNVISGNDRDGLRIVGLASTGNRVDYNLIGLNAAGLAAVRNSGAAVGLVNTQSNTIGKPLAADVVDAERNSLQPPVYCINSVITDREKPETGFLRFDVQTGEYTYTNCDRHTTYSSPPLPPGRVVQAGSHIRWSINRYGGLEGAIDTSTNAGYVVERQPGSDPIGLNAGHAIIWEDDNVTQGACDCPPDMIQEIVGRIMLGLGAPEPADANTVRGNNLGVDVLGEPVPSVPAEPAITVVQGSDNEILDNNGGTIGSPLIVTVAGSGNDIPNSEYDTFSTLPLSSVLPLDHLNNGVRDPNDPSEADGLQNHFEGLKVGRLPGGGVSLTGTLQSTANTNFDVDLFAVNVVADVREGVPGHMFQFDHLDLLSPQITTNAGGMAMLDLTFTGLNADYFRTAEYITASVTVASGPNAGNTSEISIPVKVPVGNLDRNNDGKTDVIIYDPGDSPAAQSFWHLNTGGDSPTGSVQFGVGEDVPLGGDYDGDGIMDFAVRRPSNNTVYFSNPTGNPSTNFTAIPWGAANDRPVAGDFDDDGRSDIVVFRPSDGNWYVLRSLDGTFAIQNFGLASDKFTPADYDGDGRDDIAVFRNGSWYIRTCSACPLRTELFGLASDIPVPADYDGDGKADIAVWRPSSGIWYIQRSTAGFTAVQFGVAGDKVLNGDFDADGKNDIAVWRPSNGIWYILRSEAGFYAIQWGQNGDVPVPAFPNQP